jgi:homoserine kinase
VRVASAEAYRRLVGGTAMQAWQMGSAVEGHPDNAAPAGLGGLISGLLDNQGVWRALPQEIHSCWQLVTAIPEFSLLTVEARRVLPKKYEKTATLFNLARLPYLIEGLRKGDSDLVRWGCDDQLHQPHRASLIPGFHHVIKAGVKAGAAAVYLSGAGPTMAAFVDRRTGLTEAVKTAMHQAFRENGVEANPLVLEVDHQGLRVLEGSQSLEGQPERC